MNKINLPKPLSFEWDKGNLSKIFKRNIAKDECEQVFESDNAYIHVDYLHSQTEDRYILVGLSKQFRHLFIAFAIRNNSVRIISARYMHKKEIIEYEKKASSSKF